MGCCCSKDESFSASKRHPLLRENHSSFDFAKDLNSGTVKNSSIESDKDLNPIETRARLDSIRGPPILISLNKDDHSKSPSIVRGNLKSFMKLEYFQVPDNVPLPMWYRIHLKDLIEHIRLFNSIIRPHCRGQSCKTMVGPPEIEYKWTYDKKGQYSEKINKSLSASSYIDKVIDTSELLLKTYLKKGVIENSTAIQLATKTITTLLFRAYCHILYHHHNLFAKSYSLLHLNNCFSWFILFSSETQMLDNIESEPLQILISEIVGLSTVDEQLESNDEGLQLNPSYDERMSSFFSSISDDVSKLTVSSQGTNFTLYSGS